MAKAKAAAQMSPAATNVTPIGRGRKPRALSAEATDSTREVGLPEAAPAVIVFGLDEGGKPHASWFGAADAALAERAAGLMRYKVLPITTDEHRAAASGLAAGRVFASGRCFSPFAKMAAYEALNSFEGAFTPATPPEPQPEPPLTVTGTPQRWEDIGVGSLLLATVGDDQGWFEAIVAEARGEGLFVLRWQGWPDDAAFVRRADGLALLPATPVAAAATATA